MSPDQPETPDGKGRPEPPCGRLHDLEGEPCGKPSGVKVTHGGVTLWLCWECCWDYLGTSKERMVIGIEEKSRIDGT